MALSIMYDGNVYGDHVDKCPCYRYGVHKEGRYEEKRWPPTSSPGMCAAEG